MIPLTWDHYSSQIHRDRKWNGGYQGSDEKRNGQVLFHRVKEILETDTVDGCGTMQMHIDTDPYT